MEKIIEEWRDIPGYEGLYQVSNFGRVRSLDRIVISNGFQRKIRGCILKPSVSRRGYYLICLQKESIPKTILVHRLVAQVFIPNPNNLPCVNHKSEIKTENSVENIEWCSYKYNSNYGTRTERFIKSKSKKVAKIAPNGDVLEVYNSAMDAAQTIPNKNTRSQAGHIRDVCNGVYETSGGYRWKYYE